MVHGSLGDLCNSVFVVEIVLHCVIPSTYPDVLPKVLSVFFLLYCNGCVVGDGIDERIEYGAAGGNGSYCRRYM